MTWHLIGLSEEQTKTQQQLTTANRKQSKKINNLQEVNVRAGGDIKENQSQKRNNVCLTRIARLWTHMHNTDSGGDSIF